LRLTTRFRRDFAVTGLVCAGLIVASASPAAAQTGGAAPPGGTAPPAGTTSTGKPGKAKLLKNGRAVPPANAPANVVAAIEAANRIRKKPYIYGGGHQSFDAKGYDCSGAVSYALNAAGMLTSPMPSGPLMRWGVPGKGRWISVYANGGHVYAVIAGLRWDTSSMGSGGNGPRWRATKRSPKSFTVRHYDGY
jgi:hypothetical protein